MSLSDQTDLELNVHLNICSLLTIIYIMQHRKNGLKGICRQCGSSSAYAQSYSVYIYPSHFLMKTVVWQLGLSTFLTWSTSWGEMGLHTCYSKSAWVSAQSDMIADILMQVDS